MNLSVLQNAKKEMIELFPFPHIIIPEALPLDLYSNLAQSFPKKEVFNGEEETFSNRYHWYPGIKALKEDKVENIWKEFIKFHTSKVFFQEFLTLFGDQVESQHKNYYQEAIKKEHTVGIRKGEEIFETGLDCQLVYCSPVYGIPSSSRKPHLDREVAVFGGLLYFRENMDDSIGGDFVVFQKRENISEKDLVFDEGNHIDETLLTEVKRIPYTKNLLVLFINSPKSIHGVSPRYVTSFPRLHVNFLGQVNNSLFQIPKDPRKSTKASL